MKQLVCEMCGSTDLIKQDGVFVCQACGCKYSVEEARKMMVEGTVDVSGSTVKIDSSDELVNLYQLARRARDEDNSENAAKYYDMILVKEPTSWEASFYMVYFKAMGCKIAEVPYAASSVANCLKSVLTLICDHVPIGEQASAVCEVVTRCKEIASMMISTCGRYKTNDPKIVAHANAGLKILYTCGTQIEELFERNTDITYYAADAYEKGIDFHQIILPELPDKNANQKIILKYLEKIRKYDPQYYMKQERTRLEKEMKQKRTRLEKEIKILANTIATTPTKGKFSGLGVFVIVWGIIFLVLVIVAICAETPTAAIFSLILGILTIFLGIRIGKPNKSLLENNRKIVAQAQKDIEAKRKELETLQNQ